MAYLNRPSEALRMVEQLRLEFPFFTCAFARKELFYLKRPEQLPLYLKGLDAHGGTRQHPRHEAGRDQGPEVRRAFRRRLGSEGEVEKRGQADPTGRDRRLGALA